MRRSHIEIEEDGTVHIASIDAGGDCRQGRYLGIVKVPEVGEVYDGEVVGIKDFGAVRQAYAGKDGLLHISRVANGRVGKVEDVLNIGDIVKVEVIEVSDSGKISLDRVDKPDVVSSQRPSRHHDDGDRRGKREGSNGGRKPRRRHNGDHAEH